MNSLLEKFKCPPDEYGEVSFFWWHGDPIEKEKLTWILNQLKEKHICGVQINYCHSDKGGQQYGLTMESTPKPLTEEWFELVGWFMEECKKWGISVSLSDYTLGAPGQESYMDAVLQKHPEFVGQILEYIDGEVRVTKVPYSANPMSKGFGEAVAEEFYGAFERHFTGECGKAINFFFSDELNFNVRGNLWSDDFAQEFEKRKGYDILPKLEAIFKDIGDITPKIRLDYYDVIVQLSEEGYFQPIYEWHEKRGMIFGCDHGGRGRDITEFGDYFRTMKWNQGPGNDQPHLESDIIKNKVSSSIAHLYERPRTWLEGFYSSGWQTTSADVADAIFRNFVMGHNLLSLHGLYYSTHGSMWEWAPPCNHYHMPYWKEMGTLLLCSKRLSYLLSQGVHCCDIGILYPVAAMEADIKEGKHAVDAAFGAGEFLYNNAMDFDFIDFQSIERSKIVDGTLCVSKESYRMIIVPNMKTVRFAMLEKLVQFAKSGGCLVFLNQLPTESDRRGRNDKVLQELLVKLESMSTVLSSYDEILSVFDSQFQRDFQAESVYPESTQPFIQHRKINKTDLYFVYKAEHGVTCKFRTAGVPVMLNPWNGDVLRLEDYKVKNGLIELPMIRTKMEPFLLLFLEEKQAKNIPAYLNQKPVIWHVDGEWECKLLPTMDNQYGDYRLPITNQYIEAEGREFQYKGEKGDWKTSVYSYAVYFWKYESMEDKDSKFIEMTQPQEGFIPYRFSLKYGVEGDAGYQGSYHGLKGKLSDDFITLGNKEITYAGSSSEYVGEAGTIYYLFSTIYAKEEEEALIVTGDLRPACIWLNHEPIFSDQVRLKVGINYFLLKYTKSGRTHFVIQRKGNFQQTIPLVTKWYENPNVYLWDAKPEEAGTPCNYRLIAPPGLYGLSLRSKTPMKIWCEEEELEEKNGMYLLKGSKEKASVVTLQTIQEHGFNDTGVFLEPIQFYCGSGIYDMSQTKEDQGLKFYSGGISYKKTLLYENNDERIQLKIGEIGCTIRVLVNQKLVVVLLAPPYECDITDYLKEGSNEVELIVYNTLHNHMLTLPTNFNQTI